MSAADDFRRLVSDALAHSGKGILAFEQDCGLKPSSIKAIVSPTLRQTPSIEKAERIAKAIGLEFYIGPPRHDASRRYDGSPTYSGEPPPAPLSPALRQALRLPEGATEADALEHLAHWPDTMHQAARRLVAARRREAQLLRRLAEIRRLAADAPDADPDADPAAAPEASDAPLAWDGRVEPLAATTASEERPAVALWFHDRPDRPRGAGWTGYVPVVPDFAWPATVAFEGQTFAAARRHPGVLADVRLTTVVQTNPDLLQRTIAVLAVRKPLAGPAPPPAPPPDDRAD